ncbi:MAG: helix-turn-helix domain-containing protein [Betaproteobacteria bacterium]
MPATVAEHEITERAAKSTLESTALEPTALEPTLEPAAEPFGSFVRAKRLAANISLKDFAKRLEVSPAYWSCVETNKEKPPVSDLIARAAQALGEHPDAYFIRARRLPPDMADPQALATVIRYYRRRFKPR